MNVSLGVCGFAAFESPKRSNINDARKGRNWRGSEIAVNAEKGYKFVKKMCFSYVVSMWSLFLHVKFY